MTETEPYLIEVGVPGPAGSGAPTTAEWNSYKASVDVLNAVPRGMPILGGAGRTSFTAAQNTGDYVTLSTPQVPFTISNTKLHRVLAWGRCKVTSPAGTTAYFRLNTSHSSMGAGTPALSTGGSTAIVKFVYALDQVSLSTSISVVVQWLTSTAATHTIEDLEVDVMLIPFT